MVLRNITIVGYEWFADVWADELLSADIRSLALAGTEYEECRVSGDFYVSGPNSAEPTVKVSGEVLVETVSNAAEQKWLRTKLMRVEVLKVQRYVQDYGDRHEWASDAFEAIADITKGDEV